MTYNNNYSSEGKTSHEFDQFIIVLTIIGIASLILGFFSLSGPIYMNIFRYINIVSAIYCDMI